LKQDRFVQLILCIFFLLLAHLSSSRKSMSSPQRRRSLKCTLILAIIGVRQFLNTINSFWEQFFYQTVL
jgi:hypothetical protein